jgi:hypothetical protein
MYSADSDQHFPVPVRGGRWDRGDTNRCCSAEMTYICYLIEEFIGLDVIPLSGKKMFFFRIPTYV